MQIKRTKNGIIVIGAQYLPDGTMIPNNYNATLDTISGLPPEMKQEAQNILTSFKNCFKIKTQYIIFLYLK
jgi:hypothetical protein